MNQHTDIEQQPQAPSFLSGAPADAEIGSDRVETHSHIGRARVGPAAEINCGVFRRGDDFRLIRKRASGESKGTSERTPVQQQAARLELQAAGVIVAYIVGVVIEPVELAANAEPLGKIVAKHRTRPERTRLVPSPPSATVPSVSGSGCWEV